MPFPLAFLAFALPTLGELAGITATVVVSTVVAKATSDTYDAFSDAVTERSEDDDD
ncbi:MAG: hypothetical protein LBE81_06525 [Azonexus sp.]|jgi:hypothetical protein|uniref:hypothetical protein n=1 Tax=Azonexus sp. TaxID=1872668 RepID=UPI00283730B5|nr:hypothetical protein [Azonexus sp.]MDR0776278.1 hypothetical protein [Azonexus sp.]